MTNTVLIKRSGTANSVPVAGNLSLGELAINYADGNLFYKNSGGAVTVIASNKFSSVTGNVTANNGMFTNIVNVASFTGAVVSVTGNVNGGNLITSGIISANNNLIINSPSPGEGGQLIMAWSNTPNVTGQANQTWNFDVDSSNVLRTFYQNSAGATSVLISVSPTSNIVSFPSTAGISATGNVTGSYFIGNGSQLTGISGGGGTPTSIVNGTSNVVAASSGNVTVGVAGTPNIAIFATTGEYVTGLISATGNITGGNVSGTALTGTLATAAQPNITSTGTLTSLSVSGTTNLGAVGNLTITGGTANYVLQTNGSGTLSWTALPSSATITVDNFTGNGVQTAFVLSTTPTSKNQTNVNYNGATVLRSDYTLLGSTITFSSAPANSSLLEITTINVTSGGGGGGTSAAAAVGYSLIFGG